MSTPLTLIATITAALAEDLDSPSALAAVDAWAARNAQAESGDSPRVRAAIDDLGAQPGSPQALLATAVTLALAGDDPASALRHELAALEQRLT